MIVNIINKIKINSIYKKKIIRSNLNKYELSLIKTLIKINFIKYVKKNKLNYDIYINYIDNKLIFQNIINLHQNSKKVFISYKLLRYLTFKYKMIIILNTNKGVLTNFEALKYKLGGVIILKLWN